MPQPGGQQYIVDDAPGDGRSPYAPRQGTSVWHGTSEPPDSLGKRGDTYQRRARADADPHEVWDKTATGWVRVAQLVTTGQRGTANGVASLDTDGRIPAAQIPPVIADDAEVIAAIAGIPVDADPGALRLQQVP